MDLTAATGLTSKKLQTGREASLFKKIDTSVRKLGNKVGPVRFVWHSAEQRDLNALLAGKSDQFVRTLGEQADIFRTTWIRESVEMLHSAQTLCLPADVRALRGDVLIAAHFGIRSGKRCITGFPGMTPATRNIHPIDFAGTLRRSGG
jgi:CelD/BcsL family acetyltransferase involved in cellulose biosynthesis